MAIPRVSANLGRTVFRRAATQSRTQAWRQAARRHASTGTASAEKAKKTSDIPWMIGSVAFTVPAAVWLLGQGPQKSDHHGAGHEDEHKEEQTEGQEEEAPAEEGTEDKAEGESDEKSDDKSEEKPEKSDEKTEKSEEKSDKSEDKSEGESEEKTEDKSKDKKDSKSEDKQDSKSEDKKDPKSDDDSGKAEEKDSKEDGDDQKSEGSSDEGSEGGDGKETPDSSGDDDEYEKPGPNAPGQINYKSSMARGPGENQKGGARPKSETSGEKNSAKDKSGAKHPYLDDDEKSKKGEGLKETQRIHGTVASDRPLR